MIRGVQVAAHQPEQRRDEAFGPPKRQVEEHAEGQCRDDSRGRARGARFHAVYQPPRRGGQV